MNIFYLHDDVERCAQYHCNKHVVKMCLEYSQMLCTTAHELGLDAPYKAVHRNHPCSVWVRENRNNFLMLWNLGMALCREYTYRYDKVHKSQAVIEGLKHVSKALPNKAMTPPPQCMPDQYKVNLDVPSKWEGWARRTARAYGAYYRGEKAGFAKWSKRGIPPFMYDKNGDIPYTD